MTDDYQQAIDRHMLEWRKRERQEAIERREKFLARKERGYTSPLVVQKISHEEIEKILEQKRRDAKSS